MTVALHDAARGPVPVEALAWFRRKGLRPGFSYEDVWREEHAYAFTAAKVMREDVLRALHEELARALEEGRTYEMFRRDIEQRFTALGWWGDQPVRDPITGRVVEVNVPSRLARIFDTNMRTAAAAGQWKRIERTRDSHPFLLYLLGPSHEHRPEHVEWAGTVLPVEHEFWDTHFPPNGWGCKCWIRHITERTLKRLREDGVPVPGGTIPVRESAPVIRRVGYTNARTGESGLVPEGIDPGWDYNFGKVRPAADGSFTPSTSSQPRTAEETLRGIEGFRGEPTDPAAQRALRTLLGADVDPESVNRMASLPGGFRHATRAVELSSDRSGGAALRLATDIEEETGEQAARLVRTVARHPDGRLEAHHDYLVVEDEVQSTGLGSHILRAQMRSYDEWGVNEITVDAAWAGRYVWPRMGFELDAATMQVLRDRYAEFLVEYAGMTPVQARATASSMRDAYAIAHHDPDPSLRIAVGYGAGETRIPGVLFTPAGPRGRSSPRPERVRRVPAGVAFLLAGPPVGPRQLNGGRVDLDRASESRRRYIEAIGYDDGGE